MNNFDKIANALDQYRPRWATELADQRSLQELAEGTLSRAALRSRVAQNVFATIINAALVAGVVVLPATASQE